LTLVLGLALLWGAGCAKITRPNPTVAEVEEAQLTASRRHPYKTGSLSRASQVFIRLLATVPQSQGQTYPFLGFNWWITEGNRVVIDNVWRPSPAHDVGLRQGDLIIGVNNWPIHPWVADWDRKIRVVREFSRDLFWGHRRSSYTVRYYTESFNLLALPGEILVALMLDVRHVMMEARGQYLSGPVELLIDREGKKFTVTLYPQHLPAEYAILVDTSDRSINAFAAPGRIILTSRLVSFCLNEDELALVVGHELAHQVHGHLVRGAGHRRLGGLAGKVWSLVGLFATQTVGRLSNLGSSYWLKESAPPSVRDAVVSTFSREDEREADLYGMWFAYQAGYDIERGLAVWERLGGISHDPFETTEFLHNHPAPLERLACLRLAAECFKNGRAADVFLQAAELPRGLRSEYR
jgi:Zn-dependent protease with chaperone function